MALRVERGTGTSGVNPGAMDERFGELIGAANILTPEKWDDSSALRLGRISMWRSTELQSCCE